MNCEAQDQKMEKFICILFLAFGAATALAVEDSAIIISDNVAIASDNVTAVTSLDNVISHDNMTSRDNVTTTTNDNVTAVTSDDNMAPLIKETSMPPLNNVSPDNSVTSMPSRANMSPNNRMSAAAPRDNAAPLDNVGPRNIVTPRENAASNNRMRSVTSSSTSADVTTEALETFQQLEKRMKGNVAAAVKMVLPHLMRGSADARVSGQCSASVLRIIGGVRQLKEWAMRCE